MLSSPFCFVLQVAVVILGNQASTSASAASTTLVGVDHHAGGHSLTLGECGITDPQSVPRAMSRDITSSAVTSSHMPHRTTIKGPDELFFTSGRGGSKPGTMLSSPFCFMLQLAFEAEIRFKDAVEAVEAKLSKMQEILDWGNLMGLEEFLRPKKADAEAFTTAQELGNRSPPDPCISKKNGKFEIACKENIVALPPPSSPDKAAILLFTVYFILNVSYPYTFQ
ncbi:hypothetical protein HPB50_012308 [Hyalomma asiaticum]|uniref:Uncharacterized protein n=1 Tax=Hyalomma asiaticum TaxID=266040 RepID=A0ACB7RYH5_HYAAI|nr:hypothetical protein HPB50_012308 [Hyalomma asiaticum]